MNLLKATAEDFPGRFREVISDPLNLLIARVPMAGVVEQKEVYLHNGNRVPVTGQGSYYGDFSLLLVMNRGVHEPLEEYVFQELLRVLPEAPLMIELGAYWGHYSMWLKKLRPKSQVILVEPDRGNLEVGAKNFVRNGFQGEFIQSVVGVGHLEVDQFLGSRNLARLDILHTDIQGYEGQMLQGAQKTLMAQAIDYLFISTHSQELHSQIVNELARLHYRVEVSSDFDNDTTSFDGFVFASSPRVKEVFKDFVPIGRAKIAESPPDQLLQGLVKLRSCTAI